MNDTADTSDIAKAAEATRQQMFERNIEEKQKAAEEKEQKRRIAEMNANIKAQEAAYTRKAREEEEKRQSKVDAERAKIEREKQQRTDRILKEQGEAAAAREKAAQEARKKEADERERKEKAEARIKASAEAVRYKQEAQESLAAMKKEAAAKQAAEKAREKEEETLRSAKATSAQRIAARNRIDEMNRREAQRVEAANAGLLGTNTFRKPDMKKITPSTIRASIASAASKTPAALSSATTSMFGGFAESMIRQPTDKGFQKFYKQEAQSMSKAVKGHAKNPLTGGKVTPVLKGTQVAVAPGYIDALLGRGGTVRTHTKKSGGVFSGLDNFVKRI